MNLRWQLGVLLICGVCCTSLFAQPINNNCASAIPVTVGHTEFTTVGATADGIGAGFTSPPCTSGGTWSTGTNLNVWFTFTPTVSDTYFIGTCGPGAYDSKIVVYAPTAVCGALSIADVLACDDDNGGTGPAAGRCNGGFAAAAQLALTGGLTYLIDIGGFGATSVGAAPTLTILPAVASANDDCLTPDVVLTGIPVYWDSFLATASGQAIGCGTAGTARDVWLTWTAPATGVVAFDASNRPSSSSTQNTRMQVFLGPGCPVTGTQLECDDDDGVSTQAMMVRSVTAGDIYMIQLNAGASATAEISASQFVVDYIDNGLVPTNNTCGAPTALATGVPSRFSILLATGVAGDSPVPTCGSTSAPPTLRDIWYTWIAPSSGFAGASLCDSVHNKLNNRVAVYTGACGALTSVICSDNACGPQGIQANAVWPVIGGTSYLIQVSTSAIHPTGVGGSSMADNSVGLITVGLVPPPGDECAGAIVVSEGLTLFDTSLGYTLSSPSFSCGASAPDIWYSYTPVCSSTVRLSTCGSTGLSDTVVQVYAGCGGPLVTCLDDSFTAGCDAFETVLDFSAIGGTNYRIRVSGWGGGTGAGQLRIGPPNDSCAEPTTVFDGATLFTNRGATVGEGAATLAAPPCTSWAGGGPTTNLNVWFRYQATCSGDLTVQTCTGATPFDTKVVVYNAGTVCPALITDVLGCNDDGVGCPAFASTITVPVTAGSLYLIEVGGFAATTVGCGQLNISCLGVLTPTGLACSVVTPGGSDVALTWTDAQLYDFVNVYVDAILHSSVPSTGGANGTTLLGLTTFTSHSICIEGQVGPLMSLQSCCVIAVPGDGTGLEIIVDQDAGGAIDSTAALNTALINNGLSPLIVPNLGSFIGTPNRTWVMNGTFGGGYHVLTAAEGQRLADLIVAGGHVYLESGDAIGFDPVTPFQDYNGLDDNASTDGDDSMNGLTGLNHSAALLAALSAGYNQDILVGNDFTDRYVLSATDLAGANSGAIWRNDPLAIPAGVGELDHIHGNFYNTNAGFGKVLVQSWEFGGYAGSQDALAAAYIAALQPTAPPAAISGLSCSYAAGSANASWTNNGTYDEIRVYVDGLLVQTLGGGATSASVVTATDIQLCIEPFTLRAGVGAQVCCDIGRPPTAVTDLACVLGAGGADVSWTNTSTYDAINVYVDGLLAQTLPGGAVMTFVATSVDIEICIEPVTTAGGAGAQVCCNFTSLPSVIAGDLDGTSTITIGDSIIILSALFPPAPPGPLGGFSTLDGCPAAFDCNSDNLVNIADPIYLLSWTFAGGPPPPSWPGGLPDCHLASIILGCLFPPGTCP